MIIRGRPSNTRGMMLIELLGALAILGLFSLVATEVWYATMHITVESHDAPRVDRKRDAMIERLRADVWSSLELSVKNDHTLVLDGGGDRSITWTVTGEDHPIVHRPVRFDQKVDSEQTWDTPNFPARFAAHGPGVRIEFPSAKPAPLPIDLYSELVQLTGGPQ